MDFVKYQNLHSIIMLKDVIRKWWHSELCFADKNGQVVDWQNGDIVPPPNDFCRLSLFSKEGFRRCTQSIRVLHEKFRSSKKLRGSLFHDCHLNFTIAGAPIYINNEYEGFLFIEGFARQPLTEREGVLLKTKISELNQGATDLDRALERVPVMPPPEVDRLTDLLEFGATEIANYESEMVKKDETIQTLSSELHELYRFENIIGSTPRMQEVFRLMERVSNADSPVLVEGEPGTGKELTAKAIHFNGLRKDRPFVSQSCNALDDAMLESALFGHAKGAFPGATRDKRGLIELADTGTLFLEEVGELSQALQHKLMSLLQEGTLVPVGTTVPREVNVRVIASSQRDLEVMVKEGRFREDLYYRINVVCIRMPPLRERPDDLPMLVDHFIRRHHQAGQRLRGLSPDALAVFEGYGWPGNIRELENEIERLLVLGADHEFAPRELISPRILETAAPGTQSLLPRAPAVGRMNDAVELLEREMIGAGLERTGNNKSRLARELGISRSNLILKIAKYGFDRGDEAEEEDAAEAV